MAPTAIAKKAKGKKHADPNETSKLLAAKISQLEQDAAGEKDQEAEIGTFIICRILVYCIVFFLSLLRLRNLTPRGSSAHTIYRARGQEGY